MRRSSRKTCWMREGNIWIISWFGAWCGRYSLGIDINVMIAFIFLLLVDCLNILDVLFNFFYHVLVGCVYIPVTFIATSIWGEAILLMLLRIHWRIVGLLLISNNCITTTFVVIQILLSRIIKILVVVAVSTIIEV